MEERELRSRVSWIVGLVLATAFVGTIIWSVAQDSDDDGGEDQATFDSTGVAIDPGDTSITFDEVGEPIGPDDLFPPVEELPEYTLTVHEDGCGVIRTPAEPNDLTWVVKDQDGFQVLGRNADGEDRYRYFQPGTYTVVLETYGGSEYVEVSNTVTIHC